MKKLYKLLALSLLTLTGYNANAQVGAYTFAASSGTYTPITGGTDVDNIEADGVLETGIPIGFTFNLDGTDFTTLSASSDGYLSFGTNTFNTPTNDLDNATATRRPLVAPFWDDLDAATGSAASYVVTGTSPNQVFTFEWLNWERYNSSSTDPILSFQVKLYETSNIVEFIYRNETGTISTSTTASIGMTGMSSFISLDGSGVSPAASTTSETTSISAVPADGQVYTFTPPSCPAPTALMVSNITATSAEIAWTSGGASNWNIEYGPSGFAQGSGTLVLDVANSFTISPLMSQTDYDVYVQDSCGMGDVSAWVMVDFTTPCAAIQPAHIEDFTSMTSTVVPSCWTEAGDGDPSTGPTGIGSSNWISRNFLNTGTNSAKINIFSTNDNEWLISPEFDLSGTTLWELGFDAGVTAYNSANDDDIEADDEIILLISEDNGTTWDTLEIFNSANEPSHTGVTKLYDLSSYTGSAKFAFWVNEGPTSGGDIDFYVDNFDIHELPACVAPTNLTATAITDTDATLGWTTGGAANANIEYGIAGFTQGMGTMVVDAANPFTVSTLMSNTAYEFYVQDSCGMGDVSDWTGPFSFATELAVCNTLTPVTLPFLEDFESINDSVVGDANVFCGTDKAWDFLTDNQSFGRLRMGNFSLINNGGNGAAILDVSVDANTSVNELILTLDMSNYTTADNVYLSFDFNDLGDEDNVEDRVWVRGSIADAWIEVYDWSGINQFTWNEINQGVFVSSFLIANNQMFSSSFQVKFGQNDNFAFVTTSTVVDGFALDNVKLELVSCPAPTDLAVVSQNMDSVVLNWNIGSAETMWNVEYGSVGYTPGMGTMVMSADTTDTIVGLDLGAVYDFYVQADCGSGDVSSWVGPITVATPILNDEPCDAVIVMPNTDYSSVAFSNIDASTQANEATRVPGAGTHFNTVWFKTVVPASGHIMIATCGSDFTTRLGVYAGDTAICDSLETFGFIASATFGNFALCGNSSYAGLELCGQNPGDTLLFYVGGSSSTQEGIINLTVTDLNLEGFAGEGVAQSVAICAGDTLDLFSQLSGQLLNVGEWTYPSNPSAIINNASINTGLMSLVGNEVYYSLENGCDQDTATVMINPVAKTNTGMAISNFQACSNGDVFLFDALTGTIDAGGTWSTNTGAPFNGNKFIANGLPNGPYQFTYSLDNGVCAPSSTEVEINLVSCTSISEDESTTFGVYPNPNDGNFFISNGNIESNVVMEVLDVQGKVIFSNTYVMAAGAQQEISLGNVGSGVYLVRIVTNNQVFNSNVVVK